MIMTFQIDDFDNSNHCESMIILNFKKFNIFECFEWLTNNNIKYLLGARKGIIFSQYILFKNEEDATAFRLRFEM